MRKILKTLKPYWLQVILVTVMMVIMAFCDLALPQYTSDIIDVGITNKGVSHILPERITSDDFEAAELFMTESEKAAWEGAYDAEGSLYTRNINEEEELDRLDQELMIPLLMDFETSHTTEAQFRQIVSGMLSQVPEMSAVADQMDSMSLDELGAMLNIEISSFQEKNEDGELITCVDMKPLIRNMVQSGTGTEVMDQFRETTEKMVDTMGSMLITSMGASFAASCNEKAGIDLDDLQMTYMWSVFWKMALICMIMLVIPCLVSYTASGVGAAVGRNLRRDIFHNVMSFSSTEMNRFSTASLITRSTNDIQQIQIVIVMLLRMLMYAPILCIGGIYKVIQTKADMEWIIVLAVAGIVILVAILMGMTIRRFKLMQKLIDALNLISREILTGLPVIRAFGRETEETQRFDRASKELAQTQLFTSRSMTLMMPGMNLIMYGTTLLIVWVAAHRIDSGNLQIGTMTAFITYSMMIVMSFLMITMISIFLPRAGVAAERIDEVLQTRSSIREPEAPQHIGQKRGLIEFSHVGFAYPGADEEVLSDISFTVEPGKTTALIGSTGSGKSTLISLIPRFYDVTSGSVTVDGVDVRNLPIRELREMIGFVPQKGVLFSGTIASNLRFGNENASLAELEEAAAIAQASEIIEEKSERLESPIAQGGTNVSGGQKQRLAIARAIVKKPEIFVFDDSFSALDMKTDARLRCELARSTANSAVVIVAQRVSTIMHADQIIVLDEGRIVGKGTHEELLRTCEVYHEIASSQLSKAELDAGKGAE